MSASGSLLNPDSHRHAAFVRVTHWLTVIAFLALLITGAEIVISHPRFYWGETGNMMTRPLFTLPIPASRPAVTTAYNFMLPDQNGWSRYLHFQAAWLLVFTGLVYVIAGLWTHHFRNNILPPRTDWNWHSCRAVIATYLHRPPTDAAQSSSYNTLQRFAYLGVIFVLFPLVIWTGLALSPSFDSAAPFAVNLLGGRQSARTLHFFITDALVLFFVVHIAMVWLAGFTSRTRAMIIGPPSVATPATAAAIAPTAVTSQERA